VNVNGGVIVMGYLIGMLGVRIMLYLVFELKWCGGGVGVVVLCGGGG